jgi:hypothetical protein
MLRRLLTAFTLAALTLSASGQERLLIERIEVRNAQRVSPDVIVDESLLRAGAEYSESDVRAAIARLNRLPFLLSAEYTLETGTEEDRRVLVITVVELRRLSFVVDARGMLLADNVNSNDYDFDRPGESNDALAARWFVGDRGVAHFAMAVRRGRREFKSNRYTAWELGYTHYDLFGTRLFATVNVRSPVDSVDERHYTPQFVAGFPLTTSQTLSAEYIETTFVRDSLRILGTDFERLHAERVVSLAWTYDTTDRPFAPTHGTLVRVAPQRVMTDRASFRSLPGHFEPQTQHTNSNGVDLAALRYWKLSDVNSVSGGILAGWANVKDSTTSPSRSLTTERNPTYEILQVGYTRTLGKGRWLRGVSHLALEGRLVRSDEDSAGGSVRNGEKSFEASAAWVRRITWGTLRLGVAYEER